MKKYRALVIGTGRIGAFYDAPADSKTLTHCHAYRNNPRTELAGVVDRDITKAQKTAALWATTAYGTLSEALQNVKPDIVSICTPSDTHREIVEAVMAAKPAFIFLEKPMGARPGEAEEIQSLLSRAGIPCMVNFPRSFDPSVRQLAKDAAAGRYGAFITGVVYYAKGLRHNGSHVIHLIRQVLGEIDSFQVLDHRVDFEPHDPSLDVFIRLARGGTVHLIPVDERVYSLFDATFFFEEARIHFRNFGFEMSVSRRRPDPVFEGYWDLTNEAPYQETGLGKSMDTAVEQIVSFLDTGAPFESEAATAVRTETVIDRIAATLVASHG